MTTWTPARIEELARLWGQKPEIAAAEIASIMGGGLTRNAVLGRVHRDKLPPRVEPVTPLDWPSIEAAIKRLYGEGVSFPAMAVQLGISRTAAINRAHKLGLYRIGPVGAPKPRKPKPVLTVVAPMASPPSIPFAQTTRSQCRYFVDSPTLAGTADSPTCGARTIEGGSYCEAHQAIVWRPRPERRARSVVGRMW